MRLLDLDLINERLVHAHERGLLTEGEFTTLRDENCLTPGAAHGNEATGGTEVADAG